NAIMLVNKPMSMADIRKHILVAQAKLNAYGITSVQTDDLIMVTQDKHSDLMHLFEEMAESQALTVRVYLQAQFFSLDNFKRQIEGGYRQNAGNLLYKNGPLKILADGSLGARTAKLRAPYHDDASAEGILIHTEDELRALMSYAFENQIDVAIHGIGDYTIQFAIDALTQLQRQYPRENARNVIIHCQIMDDALIQAMAKSNIDALVQPVFLEYDMTIVESRVGKSLAKSSYAYKTMLESGIKLGFGSDAPVEDPNPFRSLYYAMTRKRPDGRSYFIDECITLNQALAAFTSEAAYFSHEENIKGKLEKGYLADFIVVSKPLDSLSPDELLKMDITATYLGGTCVYQKI
ncbi:MAG TPA: amidohydrolase family protein, partial [Fusibacter sp.]|nr:amidohydrolase family protein [Fusibacter sp.]